MLSQSTIFSSMYVDSHLSFNPDSRITDGIVILSRLDTDTKDPAGGKVRGNMWPTFSESFFFVLLIGHIPCIYYSFIEPKINRQ